MFLGCPLDVLNHCAEFFPELLVAVIDAVDVSACPGHALNDPTGLFDVLIAHLVQRKLRCVEGHSVRTMDSRGCSECDQSLVACREGRITQYPTQCGPVLLKYWVGHLIHEARNETETLLDLVEDPALPRIAYPKRGPAT
jgi:hypothetical protein